MNGARFVFVFGLLVMLGGIGAMAWGAAQWIGWSIPALFFGLIVALIGARIVIGPEGIQAAKGGK